MVARKKQKKNEEIIGEKIRKKQMLKSICLKKGVFYFLAGSEQSGSRTENQRK